MVSALRVMKLITLNYALWTEIRTGVKGSKSKKHSKVSPFGKLLREFSVSWVKSNFTCATERLAFSKASLPFYYTSKNAYKKKPVQ